MRRVRLLADRFAICRLEPDDALPVWVLHDEARFFSITRTPHETSVVCAEEDVPPAIARVERGWRAFEVEGPIPFDEVGVMAGLTAPLAAAGVPVFVVSTHDTDYLLVREADLARAVAALGECFEGDEPGR